MINKSLVKSILHPRNHIKAARLGAAVLMLSLTGSAVAYSAGNEGGDIPEMQQLVDLYQHFHINPELSLQEEKTSERIAQELETLGFKVTRRIGGYGVVAILENGQGPTVMIRADMDALPITENTGLKYSSKNPNIMHACGHDMHMTSFIGTAMKLSKNRDKWQGTLMMIAQPAEEKGGGARGMLKDGLFEKFPRPDYNLALHVSAELPTGSVGITSGYTKANVDSVDIDFFGMGGHGAYPNKAIDPVVLASKFVVSIQTLVSRETDPLEPAVVTVGAFNGGTAHNIIPASVHLKITVRTYSDEVRKNILAGIKRIANAEAVSAGLPDRLKPKIVVPDHYTPAVYNNPELTNRAEKIFAQSLGAENVVTMPPKMGGEDFAYYGRAEPLIPSFLYLLGTVSPDKFDAKGKATEKLPSLHSPFFAPVIEPSLKTGITSMSSLAIDLFNNGKILSEQ